MSTTKKKRPGRPAHWPPEFQRDAVSMVLDQGRPIADVARSLGVNEGTLGNWVSRERKAREQTEPMNLNDRAELAALRAENAELRMERDLLKRSMAFWVKESTQ
jgi:transposase